MSQERAGAATVVAQEGNVVHVDHAGQRLTADMVGFPPGFTLRPGARVVLRDEPSGVTARPLVRAVRSSVNRETVEAERRVTVGDRELALEDATLVDDEPPSAAAGGEETTLWVVESAAEGPEQVVAVRRGRR